MKEEGRNEKKREVNNVKKNKERKLKDIKRMKGFLEELSLNSEKMYHLAHFGLAS